VGAFTRYLVKTDDGARLTVVQQNDRQPRARGERVNLAWRDADAYPLPAIEQEERNT
jgi:outer membrane lipoprotein SlyB